MRASDAIQAQAPTPAPPHLLVVDDEPAIRDLVASALRRQGYRVTAREDGVSALEDLRQGDVAVLLTDLRMPRMSGIELIREARRVCPRVGSVVLTGFASTETAIQALREGADDYLTKPFALEDLRRVVERVLEARRLLGREQATFALARQEADDLRRRHLEASEALEAARRDLTLSRRDLERRVLDLQFVADFTRLLACDRDLEHVLVVAARILATRFRADVARIEVGLADGARTAEHGRNEVPARILSTTAPDLVARARRKPDGVLRDVILGSERPLEGLAASLTVAGEPAGGLVLLRTIEGDEDPGDLFLLGLVSHALQVAVEADLQRRAAEQNALAVATGLLEALEGRGALWRGHGVRVARVSAAIARRMGLSPRLIRVVETAARLHDLGAIAVPDAVLQRPGPLTPPEREAVRQHPGLGARILAPFGEAAAFVRHHRERADGSGYPDGLKATEIPVGAAVIGVAEAFDAMTHPRPYRPSRPRGDALAEVQRLRGTQFVPEIADALLSLPAGAV